MTIKQKTVTIGDTEYLISTFPATKGITYLKQLTKVIGPSFSTMSKEDATLADALNVLFENMDKVDVENMIKGLVGGATKGNMAINFDTEFSGEYDKLFLLVKEVVEFNYASVFKVAGFSE